MKSKNPKIPDKFKNLTDEFFEFQCDNINEITLENNINIILVRGIFGNLLKGNMLSFMRELDSRGVNVRYAEIIHSDSVKANAKRISNQISSIDGPIIILAHSKGGLDALYGLQSPEHWDKIKAVGIAQTTNSPSFVMKTMFNKTSANERNRLSLPLRLRLSALGIILKLVRMHKGATDLASDETISYANAINNTDFPFPVFAISTWSKEPTSIVDSYHRVLNSLNKGTHHDGQFYLYQQFWPRFKNILIDDVDHAEIVLPNGKFDETLFWMNYLKFIQVQADI